jgi:hypothetical protein
MSKMALHEPFEHLQPKLWSKEGSGVKLTVWLPTTKSRESTQIWRLQMECDMSLEISQRELQDYFRPHPIRGLSKKLWMPKVPGVQTGTVSGLLLESPGKKCHSDVASVESCKEYYMGEGGGFPWVRVVVSQVSLRSPVACPNTKRVQNEF